MKKKFDAVAWVRKVRDENHRLTRKLTTQQRLAAYQKRVEGLRKKQPLVRAAGQVVDNI